MPVVYFSFLRISRAVDGARLPLLCRSCLVRDDPGTIVYMKVQYEEETQQSTDTWRD